MDKDKLQFIEESVNLVFDKYSAAYPLNIIAAARYALYPGGKRIRPYLTLLCAEFLSVPIENVINQAVALELIHNYSLIHDDLPCMDDDAFRRGKPSVHKAFGEALAVLTGDALLNCAYEILLDTAQNSPQLSSSCRYISICAGGAGMIGGQALEFSQESIDLNLYQKICASKTGALIKASVLIPAYVKSTPEEFASLAEFADVAGLIFQFADDILDEGTDKASCLNFMSKEQARAELDMLHFKAVNALTPYGNRAKGLIDFCKFLTVRAY